jgi:hypothetical protein
MQLEPATRSGAAYIARVARSHARGKAGLKGGDFVFIRWDCNGGVEYALWLTVLQ